MKTCSTKRIREANSKAVGRMMASEPVLFDIQRALYAIPGMRKRMLLHAGPPLQWKDMCGAMKGAIAGAIIFEKWAPSYDEAIHLAGAGAIQFRPTHDHCAVAPMAGIISPSMHVLCVKNIAFGNIAYSNLNEGLGRVVRFGAYAPDVVDNLRWVNEWVGPILRDALQLSGPIPLKPIMIEAIKRGDECHNRHVAGNRMFIDLLRPYLIRMALTKKDVLKVLEFVERNYYSFLNISLAACKSMADTAQNVPYSTIVCALSRNGYETGIRVSGLNGAWFREKSSVPEGKFFNGHGPEDANPDMGDSTITETVGIGAFAMAAAPEIVTYLGGDANDAIDYSRMMYDITFGENENFPITQFGGRGSPLGIDIFKVCETRIAPIINTGIAHKQGGIGQIGAGYVRAPLNCFTLALEAFSTKYG